MAGTLDKISLTLVSMREAIQEKFGDDGEAKEVFERLISNSEDRIWYELTRIENAIRHIPGGGGTGYQRRTVQGDGTSTTFNVTGLPDTARDFFFTLNSLSLDTTDYTWVFEGTGGTLTVYGFIPLLEDTIEIFFRS